MTDITRHINYMQKKTSP